MKRPDLPKLPFRLFRLFCKRAYHADIEGDLIEHYDRNVLLHGRRGAYRKLLIDVFRLFRPGIIKTFQRTKKKNHTAMFRHNLLLSIRNFRKYKASFFINVTGLSTGLACVLLIFLWVNDELSKDQFHVNGDRLYQVLENVEQNTGIITRESNSGIMAATMMQFSEVETAIMTTWKMERMMVLTVGDKDVSVPGLYADVPFFKMFSFKLLEGRPDDVLKDQNAIVISEAIAINFFGSASEAIGKAIQLDHKKDFQVSGVMAPFPATSTRQIDFVINFETFRVDNQWLNSWGSTAPNTFLLLKEGTDANEFNAAIADIVRKSTNGEVKHRTPFVRKFTEAYLHGRYEDGKLAGGRIEYVRLFTIIAICILTIACMNFMNLSTARASRRTKEVGIKKAVGARQSSLVAQFLSESILLAVFSLIVSIGVVILLLPRFNLLTGKNLALTFEGSTLWFVPLVALITGVVAGSYPALYLSRFRPALVLKGTLGRMTREAIARKWLVVFQFTVSIVLIVCVLVVFKQIEFVQNRDLGYKKDNVLLIRREGVVVQKTETFVAELNNIPGVLAASANGHDMTGHNSGTSGITWPGKDPDDRTEFERMHGLAGFIEMMGMEMQEGRLLTGDTAVEKRTVIFNETAIKFMGITDPIGKTVDFGPDTRTIVGVVKDFNFESLHEPVKPAYIVLDPRNAGTIMVKLEGGKEQETIEKISVFYNSFNPGYPLRYRFLDDDYQSLYDAEKKVATLSRYFAGLAIVISCLGLFGLAAFTAERRLKEIGIRKVLGSGDARIVLLLSEEFMKIMIISLAIAIPLSWYMATQWLEGFVYRIELQWWYFAASGLAALVVAWLAVSMQTLKAARVNPVDCLRIE
jgi:putative ABC transport system permease protein